MKSNKALWKICSDIYREMYSKAEPAGDWDDMMEKGITQKENFFRAYYLPDEQHIEILDRHCKINKLTKREANSVSFSVNLGSGPSSRNNKWDREENICI